MLIRVLSLDLSLASTGWAYTFGQARGIPNFGLIKTNPKFSHSERLAFFRNELTKLLQEFRPTFVVIEDVYSGINKNTLVSLSEVRGIAMETCFSVSAVEPYVINTNTVKSFFKVKNKKELFDVIVDILEWEGASFEKHNDLTDACAQLMAYYQDVLKYRKIREEKDYGFLYEV